MKPTVGVMLAGAAFILSTAASIAGPCDSELTMMRSDRPNLSSAGHIAYAECAAKNKISLNEVKAADKHACEAELTMMRSDRPHTAMIGHSAYAECAAKNHIV